MSSVEMLRNAAGVEMPAMSLKEATRYIEFLEFALQTMEEKAGFTFEQVIKDVLKVHRARRPKVKP